MDVANSLSPATKKLGRRLRIRRSEVGLSQEEFAHAAGLDRSYVGSIERGERNISVRNLLRLAEAADIDPGELTNGLKAW